MENKNITFTYKAYKEESIDSFLNVLGYSSNNIFYLIKENKVLINDKPVLDKNIIVKEDDKIKVTLLDEKNDLPITYHPLNIVYEDEYILIVNKEMGIEVEPSIENYSETLANYVGYYFNESNIKSKIHLVNRLDKLTSGLVIIAKNQFIHNIFAKVNIVKKYETLVSGITDKSGVIEINIDKQEKVKRCVSINGKKAITHYRKIKEIDGNSLIEVEILTGRTHQIRLSLASINHPLINDPLYGKIESDSNMYLKAYYLSFIHPINGKKIEICI